MSTNVSPLAALVNQTTNAANGDASKGKAPKKNGKAKAKASAAPAPANGANGASTPSDTASTGNGDATGEKTVHLLKYTDGDGNAKTESYTRFSVAMRDLRDLLAAGRTVAVERTKARVKQTVDIIG